MVKTPRRTGIARQGENTAKKQFLKAKWLELRFESWAKGQGRPAQTLLRWKQPKFPFWCHCTIAQLASICRPPSQAMMLLPFRKPAKCLLWAFSSYCPQDIQATAAQRQCIFTLVLSSFTFHLTTPSESLRAIICLVVGFSCSRETRKYTWAFSSMTHLKASFHAQHNSWSQDPFCICCKRVHSYCAVGGRKGSRQLQPTGTGILLPWQASAEAFFCDFLLMHTGTTEFIAVLGRGRDLRIWRHKGKFFSWTHVVDWRGEIICMK